MKKILNWLFIITLISVFCITGCDKDDPLPPEPIPEASEVNRFIFEGLAIYYYWVADVPYLTDSRFNNEDSLNYHLNKYTDPEDLFYSHLYRYGEIDKWSEIFDNYTEIDQWLSGISESTGIVPMPVQFENSNEVAGLVIYVLKDSPADLAGIKRGDYFTKINNTELTDKNFYDLFYSGGTQTFSMATINANYVISETGITHTLNSEFIQENPVLLDTVYNIDGLKIGYLVYNGFTSAFDQKLNNSYDILLNNVFAGFKSEGIDKLIIDLRYNLGGSVQTAIYLASMIYSTDKNQVFAKTKYNDLLQNEYIKMYGTADSLNDYFAEYIARDTFYITDENGTVVQMMTTPKTPIVSLNLNELYVITSGNSASASELLINGLKPYINVKSIGSNTRGKNVGSVTLKDWIDYDND
ncbi:MAG: S41 family peptidase, partial [Prolixibacteraceae bacterium]|nr:S41 family peptidase [Prolixibacteraceae bacterium]